MCIPRTHECTIYLQTFSSLWLVTKQTYQCFHSVGKLGIGIPLGKRAAGSACFSTRPFYRHTHIAATRPRNSCSSELLQRRPANAATAAPRASEH